MDQLRGIAVNILLSSLEKMSVCLLQQAAGTYTGYQGLLGLPADEFANLTAAEKEAEGRFAVWKTLLELQEKVIDWTTGPILSREDNSVSCTLVDVTMMSCTCLTGGPSLNLLTYSK